MNATRQTSIPARTFASRHRPLPWRNRAGRPRRRWNSSTRIDDVAGTASASGYFVEAFNTDAFGNPLASTQTITFASRAQSPPMTQHDYGFAEKDPLMHFDPEGVWSVLFRDLIPGTTSLATPIGDVVTRHIQESLLRAGKPWTTVSDWGVERVVSEVRMHFGSEAADPARIIFRNRNAEPLRSLLPILGDLGDVRHLMDDLTTDDRMDDGCPS